MLMLKMMFVLLTPAQAADVATEYLNSEFRRDYIERLSTMGPTRLEAERVVRSLGAAWSCGASSVLVGWGLFADAVDSVADLAYIVPAALLLQWNSNTAMNKGANPLDKISDETFSNHRNEFTDLTVGGPRTRLWKEHMFSWDAPCMTEPMLIKDIDEFLYAQQGVVYEGSQDPKFAATHQAMLKKIDAKAAAKHAAIRVYSPGK